MQVNELKTIADWLDFMNGYRHPQAAEYFRKQREKEDEFFGDDFFDNSLGAGESERECGFRKEGGTYAVCPLSKDGLPLESFVTCSPVPVDMNEYNLKNIGVSLVDFPAKSGGTVTHVFDVVGADSYPNVADFLEEARRLGVSRRLELESKESYARLSPASRLFLLHHKAVIKNHSEIEKAMSLIEAQRIARAGCPKDVTAAALHKTHAPHNCAALHWNVIEDGKRVPEMKDGSECSGLFVERQLASGTYRGYTTDVECEFELGIFAVFPLARLEVIDPCGEYQDRVARAEHARLDVLTCEC